MTISLTRRRHAALRDDLLGGSLAILAGIAVPLAAFGKAVMAVPLIPGALIALAMLMHREVRARVWRLAASPEGAALALFLLIALASALLSDHIAKSSFTWARSAFFVGFATIVAVALSERAARATLACKALLIASAVAFIYIGVAVYIDDRFHVWLTRREDVLQMVPADFKGFGSSAACLLPVLLFAARRVGIHPALSVPVILLAGSLVIWLGGYQLSHAGLLGVICAAGLTGLIMLIGRLRKNYRAGAVAVAILAGLSVAVLVTAKLPTVDEIRQGQLSLPQRLIDPHRQLIWGFTLAATLQRPVIGYGPNTINLIAGADEVIEIEGYKTLLFEAEFIPSHPHNWVYEIASETGFAGLTALVLALLLVLRRVAILALNGVPAGWAGVAMFAAFWGSSLVNFSIWAAWWQLTFLVLLAIVAAEAMTSRQEAEPANSR